MKASSEQEVAV